MGTRSSSLAQSTTDELPAASVDSAFVVKMMQLRDNSFVRDMIADPEAKNNTPNQKMRQVRSGHYVPVKPTPLPEPKLVIYSLEMATELGLTEELCMSKEFARFFSADVRVIPDSDTWATPYALSIFGEFQQNGQCPFRNGCGYGDGRAISMQEVLTAGGARFELQLKGAGKTPFCRGGDGRAVLRSSIREFLVSEAMHHLGIGTTRALSLVVSSQEKVARPRPEETARGTRQEHCAITCRVAPSFLRVGHFEVFGRRGTAEALRSLEMLVDHALRRELGRTFEKKHNAKEKAWLLLTQTIERVAEMTAQWLRVGFCQGNFNSDNCLISGRTMDYGPFGFVEQFNPRFGSWVGSGSHFAFMNQPNAGLMNMRSLTEALLPLLDKNEGEVWKAVEAAYSQASESAKARVWQSKLGLPSWSNEAARLLSDLLRLMEESSADWTITWRQLAACLEVPIGATDEDLLQPLLINASNSPGINSRRDRWLTWLSRWLAMVDGQNGRERACKTMRKASPKYVPREWMLKQAYEAAEQGDLILVKELFEIFKHPYDEFEEYEAKYYVCQKTGRIS